MESGSTTACATADGTFSALIRPYVGESQGDVHAQISYAVLASRGALSPDGTSEALASRGRGGAGGPLPRADHMHALTPPTHPATWRIDFAPAPGHVLANPRRAPTGAGTPRPEPAQPATHQGSQTLVLSTRTEPWRATGLRHRSSSPGPGREDPGAGCPGLALGRLRGGARARRGALLIRATPCTACHACTPMHQTCPRSRQTGTERQLRYGDSLRRVPTGAPAAGPPAPGKSPRASLARS